MLVLRAQSTQDSEVRAAETEAIKLSVDKPVVHVRLLLLKEDELIVFVMFITVERLMMRKSEFYAECQQR